METQTYDLIIMLGVVLLVAIIIFWSVQYGAAIVSDLMLEAPLVLQSSFTSYASGACAVDGNMYITHKITKGYPLYAFMNTTHVQMKPADKKYYPYTDVERGGYMGFGIRPALPFINCGIDVVRKNVLFNPNVNHEITLDKTEEMRIGVK